MVELVTCRVTLQNGANSGDWLMEKSRQDPVVVFEVTSRMKEVTKPIDDLSKKLSMYKTELENILLQERDFATIVEDFSEKLNKVEEKTTKLRPVSAKYSVARSQHEDFKPIFREVQNLTGIHEAVVAEKERLERESGSKPDDSDRSISDSSEFIALQKATELDKRWEKVWDAVTKYHLQITSVLPFEEIHYYSALRFTPWLEDAEKKLKKLLIPQNTKDAFDETKKEIKVRFVHV